MSSRYQLEGLIARGGMAEVHLARAVGEGGFTKLVALKRILETYADNAQLSAMFMDEANLAARLSHPNIVQVFDFGRDEQGYFIAMEYVPGPDLANLLRVLRNGGERPPEAAMVDIMIQVLRGLDHAHRLAAPDGTSLGVIHRDVSPGNVLLTGEGVAKLSDFGVARATERLAEDTKAGKTKGKSAYMSPEQARSRPLDARSDLFSAGLVLWEALSGHRCYLAGDDPGLIRQAAKGEVRQLKSVGIEVEPQLQAVVDRALEFEPSDRFPTAAAMAEELEAYHRATYPRYNAASLGAVVLRAIQLLPPMPHTRLRQADPRTSPEAAGLQEDAVSERRTPMNRAPPIPAPPEEDAPAPVPDGPPAPKASSLEARPSSPVRRPRAQGSVAEEARVEASLLPGEREQRQGASGVASGTSETREARAISPPPKKSSGASGLKFVALALVAGLVAVGGFMLVDRHGGAADPDEIRGPTPPQPIPKPPDVVAAEKPTPPPVAPSPEPQPVPTHASPHGKGVGYLTVKCQPWCDIHIDGKPSQHRSPADHIPLSTGTHTLRLVNPTVNLEEKATVVIRANENLMRSYNLVLDH